MKTVFAYLLILSGLCLMCGCVDLYYARDFTFDEFTRDHVKAPVQPIGAYLDRQRRGSDSPPP